MNVSLANLGAEFDFLQSYVTIAFKTRKQISKQIKQYNFFMFQFFVK